MKTHTCTGETCTAYIHKLRTVSVAPSAMDTRSNAAASKQFEKERDRDISAYKRLRKEGLQPPASKGAHALEQHATSHFEIESGQHLPSAKIAAKHDRVQVEYNEAKHEAQKMGVIV